jgi:hypothetical protein
MSQEYLIRTGLIQEKRQRLMQVVVDAKAILQALLNEATAAKIKPLREINTDSILSHAAALKDKKQECTRLLDEIRELE